MVVKYGQIPSRKAHGPASVREWSRVRQRETYTGMFIFETSRPLVLIRMATPCGSKWWVRHTDTCCVLPTLPFHHSTASASRNASGVERFRLVYVPCILSLYLYGLRLCRGHVYRRLSRERRARPAQDYSGSDFVGDFSVTQFCRVAQASLVYRSEQGLR